MRPAGQVSIHFGMRGPNLALVTACTTSTHSIGIAARCIQYGDADIMVAGGAEMAFTPLGHRQLLPGARVVAAQRRAGARQPPVGPGPRRVRDGRGRRCGRARGIRAREGARRADLRRVRRLRHERRRAPHHGAARGRRGCAPRDVERDARCRPEPGRGRVHQRARHVDGTRRSRRDRSRSSARSASTRKPWRSARPSR